MSRHVVLPLVLSLLLELPAWAGDEGLHEPFDRLLRAHVDHGEVDYAAFKKDEAVLDGYLRALAATDPQAMPERERLALWINAYNAFRGSSVGSRMTSSGTGELSWRRSRPGSRTRAAGS